MLFFFNELSNYFRFVNLKKNTKNIQLAAKTHECDELFEQYITRSRTNWSRLGIICVTFYVWTGIKIKQKKNSKFYN